MGFPQNVADEVFIKCGRHCCLCGKYAGQKMELHHIIQVADGGDDTADNCIPLCFDCHAEVGSYNVKHPKGRKYTAVELKGHRDKCYAKYSNSSENIPAISRPTDGSIPQFPHKEKSSLLTWGYPNFDGVMPLYPGKLILVAGYTESKKSTYIHHIINKNIHRGHRITYCCLKDDPFDISLSVLAEDAMIDLYKLKQGRLTEQDMMKISMSQTAANSKNMVIFPAERFPDENSLLNVVETVGAEIIVIDDLNGLLINDSIKIEHFMYQLKKTAARSQAIVFIIYNISHPRKRIDMRPRLEDFPSDSYYRLCDIVQFTFIPSVFYDDEYSKRDILELITVKGIPDKSLTIPLYIPSGFTGVFPYSQEKS